MRYLLVGNYGVGNLGDEALLEYFERSFSGVEWLKTSAYPNQGEYPRFPGGIRSLLGGQWKQTYRALSWADGVVFGGGSLFTDIESVRACFLWWVHTFFARWKGKPYLLAFQGIGPFHSSLGEWFARSAVKHARFISVRDEASFLRVQEWNPKVMIIRTFDPVLSLIAAPSTAEDSKICILIPRSNSGHSFCDRAKEILSKGDWKEVHVLSMQPEDSRERQLCEMLRSCTGLPTYIFTLRTLSELIEKVTVGSFVLSQRYHGALVALALKKKTEVCPQSKDDKLASLQAILLSGNRDEELRSLHQLIQKGEDALKKALTDIALKKS